MFDSLSGKLKQIANKITKRDIITEQNIEVSLMEVKESLLDADVSLEVVKDLLENIKQRVVGEKVIGTLSAGQTIVKIIKEELTKIIGSEVEPINLRAQPPVVIVLVGLQGSGKTTSVAKLADFLKTKHKKKVLLTSCDIYRPAAIKQLEILAESLKVDSFNPEEQEPVKRAKLALEKAEYDFYDVLIIDTAGRLHIDLVMMDELKLIKKAIKPLEILLTIDSTLGQEATNIAKNFNEVLDITGSILTKVDGDARGGAALSVSYLTKKPVKFVGIGEKVTDFNVFYPDRMASRILGMGDVLSLIEEAESKIDKTTSLRMAKKMSQGMSFTLVDFKEQISQLNKMGGINSIIEKLPTALTGRLKANINSITDQAKAFKKYEAAIDSMTLKERINSEIINSSCKERIAKGAGVELSVINSLLKQHKMMQKTMKKFKGKRGKEKMAQMMSQQMGGGFPGRF